MPGIANNALNTLHPVMGVDIHRQIPPPMPVPAMAPHVVVWGIGLAFPATSKKAPTVSAGWGHAVGRQHDLGMGPYHLALNVLLPLIWLGAGNKAEFASGTVKIPTGRMAVAMIPFVGINLQLDCQDFPIPPLPSSRAMACLQTVKAGFTLGDLLGGLAAMAFDSAVSWAVAGVVSFATAGIGNALSRGLRNIAPGLLSDVFNVAGRGAAGSMPATAAQWLATAAGQYLGRDNIVTKGAGIVLGMFGLGTPLGYSYSHSVVGGPTGDVGDNINNYFSPDPPRPTFKQPVGGSTP